MTIEGQIKFLGRIPLFSGGELPTGIFFARSTFLNYRLLLAQVVSTCFFDGQAPILYPKETIEVLSPEEVECPKGSNRVIFSKEQINREKISAPTLLPGVRIHFTYQ